jgi:tripartite-type tricarboxylate transporter receptor subunit TctC
MRGKSVTIFCSGLVFVFVGLIVGAGAQVESFYRGKTITIVVGYNPGDAHDLWARAYSCTMGRYIPATLT